MKGSSKLIGCALLVCCLAIPAKAVGPIVIVFDIEDKGWGLKGQVLSNLTDYLSVRLTKGGYQVIPPSQIRERLTNTKQTSHKACYDQSCQIELGRELAAQKTISTQVFRIADVCQVTSTMYDLKKSIAEKAAFAESACDERSLLEAIKEIASELCQLLLADQPQVAGPKAAPSAAERKAAQELAARVIAEEMEYFEKEAKVAEKQASAEARKREEERSKFGILLVKTEPASAQVVLDGKSLGPSPVPQKVAMGTHQLKVHAKGYQGHVQSVAVQGGKQNEIKIALRKYQIGKLVVKTTPSKAQVYINDKEAGVSPVTQTLPAGSFIVAAEMDGYDGAEKMIKVITDKTTEVTLTLRKDVPSHPFSTWGHVAFWAGLAIAGAGGGLLVPTDSAREDYKTGDINERKDAKDSHALFSSLSYTCFGVGGALIAAGIVLWVLSPGSGDVQGAAFVPAVTPDGQGMGLTLTGRW